jgi:hypothetical protein
MILAALIQFFITAMAAGALLAAGSTHSAISFAIGGVLVGLNFLILGFAWSLIFQKKLIALAVPLIVFKYAILGLIIYQLTKATSVDLLWFSMGIGSFVISALIYIVWTARARP